MGADPNCQTCEGSGSIWLAGEDKPVVCPHCWRDGPFHPTPDSMTPTVEQAAGVIAPCPFCNSHDASAKKIRDGYQVFCPRCHGRGGTAENGPASWGCAKERAIESWNRRAVLAPAAEREEIAEALYKDEEKHGIIRMNCRFVDLRTHTRLDYLRKADTILALLSRTGGKP